MDLNKIHKLYCIGIGGIGVSAVARWARHNDIAVSGSDLVATDLTRALEAEGIGVIIGHTPENVPADADLVVYTPAVDKDHIERKAAKKKGIKQVSYPEFLGLLSEKKFTIAVTGTHGKSTTTALIGLMLQEAGFDPTVFVGSLVPQLEHGNVRVGHSNFLVVEACEHQGNMRYIKPNIAVVTYIELDHLDFYKDLKHEIKVYQEFVDELPKEGVLVTSADDPGCQQLKWKGKRYTIPPLSKGGLGGVLKEEVQITVGIPGDFNVRNALAASIAASQVGVPESVWRRVAAEFRGIWRRFEKVGEYHGALIYSDYGHHPTAIRETMKMVRELYPDRRVILVYQPHQHNRTKKLFNEFVAALSQAPVDVLVLSEIYDVAGREEAGDQDVSSQKLANAIMNHAEQRLAGRASAGPDEASRQGAFMRTGSFGQGPQDDRQVQYTAAIADTESWLRANVKKDDVVIIMGAGDIDTVARKLVR